MRVAGSPARCQTGARARVSLGREVIATVTKIEAVKHQVKRIVLGCGKKIHTSDPHMMQFRQFRYIIVYAICM